ncbi:MAG TPA: aminotransferase class V-fold PLP-dependent enzyme [Candidatus Cloacimonadota bacterium]|nr:aminotransferase class V-fold PLP-dependent enzyme [Candidatus Cloacimonadota bacterium]
MIQKSDFLLNEEIHFLNNGSYGACPKTVFAKYQEWQKVIEFQPVEFFQQNLVPELKKSRESLAKFVNTDADDLILMRNATFAANAVIRSLNLQPGDEVITTNHEYGACTNAWQFWQKERNFSLKIVNFDLPLPSTSEIIKRFEANISDKTKVIFFSQITSKTAQLFPAEELCRLARKHNIISVVDGAHVIGQYPLDFAKMPADFYFSNIHKWLFAPKGTAFLYTAKDKQHLLKPLITGWGWGRERELPSGSDYVDSNQFYGTNDYASFLCVPAAIDFYRRNRIDVLKQECNSLVRNFLQKAEQITGRKSLYSDFPPCLQMAVIEIPRKYEFWEIKELLYKKYKIEIPVMEWEDKLLLRISIQIYNQPEEVEYLLQVLRELFL